MNFLRTAAAVCFCVMSYPIAADEYEARTAKTALHKIELLSFPAGTFAHSGGAIEQWGDDLLVVTPSGNLVLAENAASRRPLVTLKLLPETVPMHLSRLGTTPFAKDPGFRSEWVRVADALVHTVDDTRAELYVSHHVVEATCIGIAVSRLALRRNDKDTVSTGPWETLFRARPCTPPKARGQVFAGHQVGGKMIMHAPDRLWLALGDHEFDGVADPLRASIDDSVDLGKVLEIDTVTGTSTIVARGLRNPQGLILASDGTVWETEHGPRGGDEVNLIRNGANYGWPMVTLGLGYGGPWRLSDAQGRHDGFEPPRFAFVPSIAVSAIAEITGDEFPLWQGDLILATLKEEVLYRLRRDGDRIVYSERLVEVGERVRDIIALDDGRLALLTDKANVVLVSRSNGKFKPLNVLGEETVASDMKTQRAALGIPEKFSGKGLFARNCAACHRLDGVADAGPPLNGLLGRAVGAADFGYSDAMSSTDDLWTEDLLYSYVRDPGATFPGTSMATSDLSHGEVREIVKWFKELQN